MTDYSELKAAALAATPGPWDSAVALEGAVVVQHANQDEEVASTPRGIYARADARYIAAASPEVVLDLIARVEELEAMNESLVKVVEEALEMAYENVIAVAAAAIKGQRRPR